MPQTREQFVGRYGGIYEHSAWVAQETYAVASDISEAGNLASVFASCVDEAPYDRKLALIRAHPDLAGKAAVAREVTGIDVEAVNDAGDTQSDNAMVVTCRTLAAALPAIHPLAVIIELAFDEHRILGLDQPLFCREEFVGGVNDAAAEPRLLEPGPCVKRILRLVCHGFGSVASLTQASIDADGG